MTVVLKVLYWLAVLVISLAVLVGLVLFLESRDDSTIDDSAGSVQAPAGAGAGI